MVSLMQRRREMMIQSGASPSGSLYRLKQGKNSFTGRSTTITGNHIVDNNTSGSTGSRNMYINASVGQNSVPSSTWFHLASGDTVTLKMKAISYTNYYTYGSATYTVSITDSAGNAHVIAGSSLEKGLTTGTLPDKEISEVFTEDVDIRCVRIYMQRESDVEFDFELWVNDIQYI